MKSGSQNLLVSVFLALTFNFVLHAENGTFDRAKEFPNHFQNISRPELEKALGSVFNRMTIPIVKPGKTDVEMVRYFAYTRGEVQKVDPTAQVLPSGGVVRSTLGYLYHEINEGLKKNPPIPPAETLRRIANSKEDLPGYKVRGVGSDFDLLVKAKASSFKEVQGIATAITNSAESAFGMRNVRSDIKRSLFTIGDIKDYAEQTERSSRQGGSTLDLLAYDLETGKLVEPKGFEGIIASFLEGKYQYIAPQEEKLVEDIPKQTIRGIRALIELPWLEVEEQSRLTSELEKLLEDIEKGKSISEKALQQFDKTVRNARYSAGHNRLYRGDENSLEQLILRVALAIEKKTGRSTIPEFVDAFEIGDRSTDKAELNGIPKDLLMSLDNFRRDHTDNGTIYHGTPELESGLAIMRGGLFVSKQGGKIKGGSSTMAAFGRGAYASKNKSTAHSYAGSGGVVFELGIADSPHLNILDWKAAQNDPTIKAIVANAKQEGRDVFEVLARDHGIDLIIHEHVLIQNIEAVKLPDDFKGLVNAYRTLAENPHTQIESRISAYSTYRRLYGYAGALGETGVKAPEPLGKFVRSLLQTHGDPGESLCKIFENSELRESLHEELESDRQLKNELRHTMSESRERHPDNFRHFPWDLEDPNDVKILREELAAAPRSQGTLRRLRERFISNLGLRFPNLYSVSGSGRKEISQVNSNTIPDEALAREWKDLEKENNRRERLDSVLTALAPEQPIAFIRRFPELSGYTYTGGLPIVEENGVRKISTHAERTPVMDLVDRLLVISDTKSRAAVTQEDLDLVSYLVRSRYGDLISHLIAGRPVIRKAAISELKQHGDIDLITDILKGGSDILKKAIVADKSWKSKLRNQMLTNARLEGGKFDSFPWSLDDADDVAALKRLASNGEKASKKEREVERRLRSEGKMVSDRWFDFHVDTDHIADPNLQKEYVWAKHQSRLALSFVPALLKKWHETNPESLLREFPAQAKKLGRLAYPSGEEKVDDARAAALLAQTIDQNSTSYLKRRLEDGRDRHAVIRRLLNPKKGDNLWAIQETIKTAKDIQPEILANKDYSKFKDILREVYNAALSKLEVRSPERGAFPWDVRDLKDITLLRELLAGENEKESAQDVGTRLITEVMLQNRTAGYVHARLIDMDFSGVNDADLVRRIEEARSHAFLEFEISEAQARLYNQDAAAYVRNFPDAKGRAEFLAEHLRWNYAWRDEKAGLKDPLSKITDAAKFMNASIEKAIQGGKLNDGDWFWIGEALKSQEAQVVKELLKAPQPVRHRVLDLLSREPQSSWVLPVLWPGSQEKSADSELVAKRLHTAIASNPGWRNRLREEVTRDAEGANSEFKDFPWDLSNPKDVEILQQLKKRAPFLKSELVELRTEIYHADRIAIRSDYPENMDPAAIRDPNLKVRFEEKRTEYLASKNLNDVLKRLAGATPVLFRRAFPHSQIGKRKLDIGPWADNEARAKLIEKWNKKGQDSLPPDAQHALRRLREAPVDSDTISHFKDLLAVEGASREWATRRLLHDRADDLHWQKTNALEKYIAGIDAKKLHPLRERLRNEIRMALGTPDLADKLQKYPWNLNDSDDLALLKEIKKEIIMTDAQISAANEKMATELQMRYGDQFMRMDFYVPHDWTSSFTNEDKFRLLLQSLAADRYRFAHREIGDVVREALRTSPDDYGRSHRSGSSGRISSHVSDEWVRKLKNAGGRIAQVLSTILLENPNTFGDFEPARVPTDSLDSREIPDAGLRNRLSDIKSQSFLRHSWERIIRDASSSNPQLAAMNFPEGIHDMFNRIKILREENGIWKVAGGHTHLNSAEIENVLNKATTDPFNDLTEGERTLLKAVIRFTQGPYVEHFLAHGPGAMRRFVTMTLKEGGVDDILSRLIVDGNSNETSRVAAEVLKRAIQADPVWKSQLRERMLLAYWIDPTTLAAFPWDLRDANDVKILQSHFGKAPEYREKLLQILREIRRTEGLHFDGDSPTTLDANRIMSNALRESYRRAVVHYNLAKKDSMEKIVKSLGVSVEDVFSASIRDRVGISLPLNCAKAAGLLSRDF